MSVTGRFLCKMCRITGGCVLPAAKRGWFNQWLSAVLQKVRVGCSEGWRAGQRVKAGFKTLVTCPQSPMKKQKVSRRFVILSVNTEIIQNCNCHTFFRTNGDKGWGFKKMESEAVSEIGGGGLEETGRQLFPLFFNGGNHCSAQTKWLLNSLKLLR